MISNNNNNKAAENPTSAVEHARAHCCFLREGRDEGRHLSHSCSPYFLKYSHESEAES